MKKYSYRIVLNAIPENKVQSYCYSYGHTNDVILEVGLQKAQICFRMTVSYSVEDIVSFRARLFRDAYVKAYLLHAVHFGQGLKVNTIDIIADGKLSAFDRNSDKRFPFLFSMIPDRSLYLDKLWWDLEPVICGMLKTKSETDLRFSAMFSYLASKGREYEIDRFSNLWTSMNAYYSFIGQEYENHLEMVFPEEIKQNKAIKLTGKDSLSIGAAAWLIHNHYGFKKADEYSSLWKKDYLFEEQIRKEIGNDISSFYEEAYQSMITGVIPDKPLYKRAQEFGQDLFTLILLGYPYNWRCAYLHGNRTTTLFAAYNDYELDVLRVVNYFMDRFLNTEIPAIFSGTYWNIEKEMQVVEYMKRASKDARTAFEKAEKLLKE